MKPIHTTIKVTEKTKTSSLPVSAQIKLLLGMVGNDELTKLEASEKVNRETLSMQSALSSLIDKATAKMRERGSHSVTVSVSSRFLPYMNDVVFSENGKCRFYDFEVDDPGSSIIGSDYYFTMTIRER